MIFQQKSLNVCYIINKEISKVIFSQVNIKSDIILQKTILKIHPNIT